MLKVLLLAAIAVVVTSIPPEDDNDEFRLYRGQSRFSVSMIKSMNKFYPGKNMFFSPHCIYRTLLRAYIGSGGPIKESLKEVLFLNWTKDENDIDEAYKSEKLANTKRMISGKLHFNSFDKFYVSKNVMINPRMKDVFTFSEIERVDLSDPEARRAEINAFVRKYTEDGVKELLPAGSIQDQKNVFLINSASFNGIFARQFQKSQTRFLNFFNGAQYELVEMMSSCGSYNYGFLEKEYVSVLEVPYQSENFSVSMFVYLPYDDSPSAVDNLIDNLSDKIINQALTEKMEMKTVDFTFPRISLKSEYLMKNVLEDMGIQKLFDFALFNNIIHKTVVGVNEEGTSASTASSTAHPVAKGIISLGLSGQDEIIQFTCDHQFFYTLNDRVTKEVLFAGIFRGPEDGTVSNN